MNSESYSCSVYLRKSKRRRRPQRKAAVSRRTATGTGRGLGARAERREPREAESSPGAAGDLPARLQLAEHVHLPVAARDGLDRLDELPRLERLQDLVDLWRRGAGGTKLREGAACGALKKQGSGSVIRERAREARRAPAAAAGCSSSSGPSSIGLPGGAGGGDRRQVVSEVLRGTAAPKHGHETQWDAGVPPPHAASSSARRCFSTAV